MVAAERPLLEQQDGSSGRAAARASAARHPASPPPRMMRSWRAAGIAGCSRGRLPVGKRGAYSGIVETCDDIDPRHAKDNVLLAFSRFHRLEQPQSAQQWVGLEVFARHWRRLFRSCPFELGKALAPGALDLGEHLAHFGRGR